jgi:O-acetyl-ADP-ribose deacetylase (regulator of RNase III)
VGPRWSGGGRGEAELLASAYRATLALADEHSVRTIGFPAISLGIYGYPLDEGARIAVETVVAHLRGDTTIERATFVLFSSDTYTAFGAALEEIDRAKGG